MRPIQMGWFQTIEPTYPYNDYLRSEWGLEAAIDYLVFPAIADEKRPDQYEVVIENLFAYPLNTFNAEHPVSAPLRGQRTVWQLLCPVLRTEEAPEGVVRHPLLSAPGDRSVWATNRLPEMLQTFEVSGFVRPDYDAGDLATPFAVAMAAAREPTTTQPAQPGEAGTQPAEPDAPPTKPARVMVLGVGASLADPYINTPVYVREAQGASKPTDPPHANADIVVNGAYWMVGHASFIASGPVAVEPIEDVSPVTWRVLWTACVVVLPLLVLALGGIVALQRRS
jgi:hypothetical protein